MGRTVILTLLALSVLIGCGKGGAPRSATDSSNSAGDPAAPASPRGPGSEIASTTKAAVISDTGDVNAVLQQLTRELRDYVVRTRTVPKNFEEFATKSQVQFPAPPSGKKYAIEGQAVVLEKR